MKLLTILALSISLAAPLSASAAKVIKKACGFDDYQAIQHALQNHPIVQGKKYKNEVLSLLSQEMGPQCNQLIPEELMMGIPGDKTSTYQLIGSGDEYKIVLSSSVEQNLHAVSIEKK